MSDFYAEMQSIAQDVMGEFDQRVYGFVKLIPANGPPQNPGTPTRAPLVRLTGAVGRSPETKFIDGTNITAEHLEVVFAPQEGVVPTLDDFIDVDGEQFKIVAIRNVPPFGTTVVHKVFIKN